MFCVFCVVLCILEGSGEVRHDWTQSTRLHTHHPSSIIGAAAAKATRDASTPSSEGRKRKDDTQEEKDSQLF